MMYAPPFFRIGLGLLFVLHGLFAAAGALGALLLVAWAIKHLSGPKLKKLGLWFFAVGIIGCILVGGMAFGMGGGRVGMMGGGWMQGGRGQGWGRDGGYGMMKGWNDAGADDNGNVEEDAGSSALSVSSAAKK